MNVQLCGLQCHEGVTGTGQAVVLLENPTGQFVLNAAQLTEQVRNISVTAQASNSTTCNNASF